MRILGLVFLFVGTCFLLNAENKGQQVPIIFIYDASGSMWGQIEGKPKIEIASAVLTKTINELPEGQQTGLVAYGHRKEGDCNDVEFIVGIENENKQLIQQEIATIKPLGKTPLALSVSLVFEKLRENKTKATVILITDGIESCKGNICKTVSDAQEEGLDFKLHIVGFGLKEAETEQLKCAATSGSGNYYDAANAAALAEVLTKATAETVENTIDNFSVFAVKNNQPIDALAQAFKAGTSTKIDGVRTYRDTGYIHLPTGKYDLKVIPLENSNVQPIFIFEVESSEDKIAHQTINFDAGKIILETTNNGAGWDATVKVKDADGKTVAGGRTYGRKKELEVNPGIYNVELKALVIEGTQTNEVINNVEVKPGGSTQLVHDFKSGVAMIGAKSGQQLVDATVKIIETTSNKTVAGSRTYTSENNNPRKFVLNPGEYKAIVTALGDFNGKKESFSFSVKENETMNKTLEF